MICDTGSEGSRRLSRNRFRGTAHLLVAVIFVFPTVLYAQVVAETEEEASTATVTRDEAIHHRLKLGDRLVHLSHQYNVSVDAILEANGLENARGLREGQEIVIPPEGTKATERRSQVTLPTEYRVHQGDQLLVVARRFGVAVDDILIANDLSSGRELRSGETIIIPRPGEAEKVRVAARSAAARTTSEAQKTASEPSTAEPRWMRSARKLAKKLGLGSRQVAQKLLRGQLSPRWIQAAGKGRMPSFLRFPVTDSVVGRGWGSGPGGYHLAADMPGTIGARVSAAAPGIVAYANNELPGFGKLVLIIHPGGLVTSYAHNSVLKTIPGERVKRGTRIALLGSTGISRGPHVHFEVIYNGELCDPLPLLRPIARTKGGQYLIRRRDLRQWPRRGGPPKGVQCAKRRRHPDYVGKPYGWRPDDWGAQHQRKVGRERPAEEDVSHPDPELGDDSE